MKKILMPVAIFLLICMISTALFGCNAEKEPTPTGTGTAPTGTNAPTTDAPTAEPTEKPTAGKDEDSEINVDDMVLEDYTYYFDDENDLACFKRLGRTSVIENKGLTCDFTASGIEFNGVFEGDITLDILCERKNDDEAYFTVYINGKRQDDIYKNGKRTEGYCHVKEGSNTVTVAKELEKGVYNIRILKQTEANYAITTFKSISFTGSLLDPPANKELYIEYIGDSLTCAMGAAGNTTITGGGSAQGMNGADWEDGTFGYAFTSAEELDADFSIIAESGIGISGSWFGATMPEFYIKESYRRSNSKDYDFERVPDLIVINLATNDRFLNSDHNSYKGQLLAKICPDTKQFIETIREKYGEDVPILWVSGVWQEAENPNVETLNDFVGEVKKALDQLGGEATGIYHLELVENSENTKGAEGHPSREGHKLTKETLVKYINDKGLLD